MTQEHRYTAQACVYACASESKHTQARTHAHTHLPSKVHSTFDHLDRALPGPNSYRICAVWDAPGEPRSSQVSVQVMILLRNGMSCWYEVRILAKFSRALPNISFQHPPNWPTPPAPSTFLPQSRPCPDLWPSRQKDVCQVTNPLQWTRSQACPWTLTITKTI